MTDFENAIQNAQTEQTIAITPHETDVVFADLTVKTPAGMVLIDKLNLTITQGEHLLIQDNQDWVRRLCYGRWQAFGRGRMGWSLALPIHYFLLQKPYLP